MPRIILNLPRSVCFGSVIMESSKRAQKRGYPISNNYNYDFYLISNNHPKKS